MKRVLEFLLRLTTNADKTLRDTKKDLQKTGKEGEKAFDKTGKAASRAAQLAANIWKRAGGGIVKIFKGIKGALTGVFGNLTNIRAGLGMVRSAAQNLGKVFRFIGETIRRSFEIETIELQFATMLKSAEKASKRVKELMQFAIDTPFDVVGTVKAARTLQLFSGGVLATDSALRMLGDAASGTNQSLEDVAFWVGRTWQALEAGRPVGRAILRLQEMGIASGKTQNALLDLAKGIGTTSEAWGLLERDMKRFEGLMKEAEKTGKGLTDAVKLSWEVTMIEFGNVLRDTAKGGLLEIKNRLNELRSSGALEDLAKKVNAVFEPLVEAFGNLFDKDARGVTIDLAKGSVKALFDYLIGGLKAVADYMGFKIRESIAGALGQREAARLYKETAPKAFRTGMRKAELDLSERLRGNAAEIKRLAEERKAREEKARAEREAGKEQEEIFKKQVKLEEEAKQKALEVADRRRELNQKISDIAKELAGAAEKESSSVEDVREALKAAEDMEIELFSLLADTLPEFTEQIEDINSLLDVAAEASAKAKMNLADKLAEQIRALEKDRFTRVGLEKVLDEQKAAEKKAKDEEKTEAMIERWRKQQERLGDRGRLSRKQLAAIELVEKREREAKRLEEEERRLRREAQEARELAKETAKNTHRLVDLAENIEKNQGFGA